MEEPLTQAHSIGVGDVCAVAGGDPVTTAALASEAVSVAATTSAVVAALDGQPSHQCTPSTHESQREQQAQEEEDSVPPSHAAATSSSGPSPSPSPLTQHVKTDHAGAASTTNEVNALPPNTTTLLSTPEISVTPSDHGSPVSVSDHYTDTKSSPSDPTLDRNQAYDDHHHHHLQASLSNQVHYRSPSNSDLIDRLRAYRECEVTTPTLEQMGLDQLDEADLRLLLQSAYEVIQEKDRGKYFVP
ncbi:hypothetical protein BGW42_004267 [Actinomortierella wolfii]|nr:hypothetical protein BGW42_004267 [Actinomortierella wolfii]